MDTCHTWIAGLELGWSADSLSSPIKLGMRMHMLQAEVLLQVSSNLVCQSSLTACAALHVLHKHFKSMLCNSSNASTCPDTSLTVEDRVPR